MAANYSMLWEKSLVGLTVGTPEVGPGCDGEHSLGTWKLMGPVPLRGGSPISSGLLMECTEWRWVTCLG